MIQFPIVAAQICAHTYSEINSHRNHPDAEPLDEEISRIAQKELNISSTEGIQVVDDVVNGVPCQSWGILSFGRLAKPVIALQKGLKESYPNARRYFILSELYKSASSERVISLALKIVEFTLVIGIFAAGGGIYVVAGKLLIMFVASQITNFGISAYYNSLAKKFAMSHILEEGKWEIEASIAEVQKRLKESMTEETKEVAEAPKEYKPSDECLIDSEKRGVDEIVLPDFVSEREVPVVKMKRIEVLGDKAKSPLDLPVKLRRTGEKVDYLMEREKYHLERLEMQNNVSTIFSALSSIVLVNRLMLLFPETSTVVLFAAVGALVRPIINSIGLYFTDAMFVTGTKTPCPEEVKKDPTIWHGCL